MKRLVLSIVAMMTMTLSASAMSYEQARNEALFLTDKMAYELNLSDAQYEAAYEINLDYLMGVTSVDDVYGTYWTRRNLDLSYILWDWQWNAYLAASYFYRPLYWDAGFWHFGVYARYPRRTFFYFDRPAVYISYRGGHSWRMNGGRSYYHSRREHFKAPAHHVGMRDRWDRGDFGHNTNHGRGSSTRITVNNRDNLRKDAPRNNDNRNGSFGNNRTSNNLNRDNGTFRNRGTSNTRLNNSGSIRSNSNSTPGSSSIRNSSRSTLRNNSIRNNSSSTLRSSSIRNNSSSTQRSSSIRNNSSSTLRSSSIRSNSRLTPKSGAISSPRSSSNIRKSGSSFGGSRSSSVGSSSRKSSSVGSGSRSGSFGGSRSGSFSGGSRGGGSKSGGFTSKRL